MRDREGFCNDNDEHDDSPDHLNRASDDNDDESTSGYNNDASSRASNGPPDHSPSHCRTGRMYSIDRWGQLLRAR